LKSLVIGYGSIGKRHIDNLSKFKNIEIIVITKRKSDDFLKKRNCTIYKSLDSGIKEKPDFAIISNETSYHLPIIKKLIKSKINFFVEKPLGNSLKNINDVLKIVNKKKIITQVGCNYRFHPFLKEIKKILKNNKLGRIISIRSENGSYLPDWHLDENYEDGYAARKNLGGGVILTCIHELDYLFWLFGKISSLSSFVSKKSDLKIDSEDLALILLNFSNGIFGEVHLDFFQKPSSRTLKIIGTKSTLLCNFYSKKLLLYNHKNKKWDVALTLKNYNNNQMYVDELTHFIQCVKHERQTINSINDGVETLKIAMMIKKSSNLKKMVRIK
jgi:predicted dehydrogenase